MENTEAMIGTVSKKLTNCFLTNWILTNNWSETFLAYILLASPVLLTFKSKEFHTILSWGTIPKGPTMICLLLSLEIGISLRFCHYLHNLHGTGMLTSFVKLRIRGGDASNCWFYSKPAILGLALYTSSKDTKCNFNSTGTPHYKVVSKRKNL